MLNESKETDVIRTKLRELGYTNRMVSVRSPHLCAIDIDIHDYNIPYDVVNRIARRYESYERDERTGEIYEGGNRFVFIEYSKLAEEKAISKYSSYVDDLIKACDHSQHSILFGKDTQDSDKHKKDIMFIIPYRNDDRSEIIDYEFHYHYIRRSLKDNFRGNMDAFKNMICINIAYGIGNNKMELNYDLKGLARNNDEVAESKRIAKFIKNYLNEDVQDLEETPKSDEEPTKMYFCVEPGGDPTSLEDILAVMTDTYSNGEFDCYSHVGQHSTANVDYVVKECRPIEDPVSTELFDELTKQGYNIEVVPFEDFSYEYGSYDDFNDENDEIGEDEKF